LKTGWKQEGRASSEKGVAPYVGFIFEEITHGDCVVRLADNPQ
jgi:hypothetical protein